MLDSGKCGTVATMQLENLSRSQALQLAQKVKEELRRRFDANPAKSFPWHRYQRWVLFDVWKDWDFEQYPVRVVTMVAANRSGKSASAKGMLGLVARLQHPICGQFRAQDPITGQVRGVTETDPLRIWVIPPSLGKARQDWIAPPDGLGIRRWLGDLYLDMRASPDLVIFARPVGVPKEEADKWSKKEMEEKATAIYVMSQDQDLLKFESSIVHLAIFDEEPDDVAQVNSVLMRLATTNGALVFAFTPLKGLSWSFQRWWKPLVQQGKALKGALDGTFFYRNEDGGRNIVIARWGMAENPLSRRYALEVEADHEMSEAEKRARLYGEYGYVEGALLPKLAGLDLESPKPEHEIYVVDELPKHGDWYLVADPNKSFGAALFMLDHDDNMYVVAEHLEEDWPDWRHAAAFLEMQKQYARGPVIQKADPGGAGAHAINNLNSHGCTFSALPKGPGSVATSIKRLRGRTFVNPKHTHPLTGEAGAPRLYFYRKGLLRDIPLEDGRTIRTSLLVEQLSQARQSSNEKDPPDTPHKDVRNKLDLFDVTRYMALIAFAAAPPPGKKLQRPDDADRLPDDASLLPAKGDSGMTRIGDYAIPEYSFLEPMESGADDYFDGRLN